MGKKVKELKYNITGKDLENYEKVKTDKIAKLQQATTFLNNEKKKYEENQKIYEMFKACACMLDNPAFGNVKDLIMKQLENGENANKGVQEHISRLEATVKALENQYNTYFENLPIVNGKAIVSDEVRTYCNIEAIGLGE